MNADRFHAPDGHHELLAGDWLSERPVLDGAANSALMGAAPGARLQERGGLRRRCLLQLLKGRVEGRETSIMYTKTEGLQKQQQTLCGKYKQQNVKGQFKHQT